MDLPLGDFSKNIYLGDGEKTVCVYLPWSVKTLFEEISVDDNSFIVSDDAIAKPLEANGAKVLKIRDGSIKLKGFKTGFIGGTAGHIYVSNEEMTDQRAIVFNGDLTVHPDFAAITEFIRSRNILPVWFEDYALEDIGSILAVE
jgi:hypothetical protein